MSAPPEVAGRPATLSVVRAMFDRLNLQGIPYCHWKSNEHLGAGLAGATDLDVLVGSDDPGALACILRETGFKRVTAVADCAYPGIDDFLAFDPGTGRLAHLHLHRQLVLGERRVKSYRLPWEDRLLATRRMDEEHAVQVADPHMELLLLVIRAALKLRARDLVRSMVPGAALRGGMEREYRWLLERVERAQLVESARPLVGERAAAVLGALTDGPPSVWQLLNFRRAVKPRLGTYRTYGSAAAARTEGWRREWRTRWNSLRRLRLGSPVPSKRTIPHGIVVVFVGCDGSGKSTMTKEVTRWLAWKLDVLPVYFGSGDGPASLLRRPLRLGKAVRRLQARDSKTAPTAPARGLATSGRLRNLRTAWWALALAHEKSRRLAHTRRARDQGMIVICDRYPQTQFMGFNDGPRLSPWLEHRSRVLRALARWEHDAYRMAALQPPDLVVKLHVTPEVAAQRKPGMQRENLVRRTQAVRQLTFPHATHVVDLDSDQPLGDVLRQIKEAIWERV